MSLKSEKSVDLSDTESDDWCLVPAGSGQDEDEAMAEKQLQVAEDDAQEDTCMNFTKSTCTENTSPALNPTLPTQEKYIHRNQQSSNVTETKSAKEKSNFNLEAVICKADTSNAENDVNDHSNELIEDFHYPYCSESNATFHPLKYVFSNSSSCTQISANPGTNSDSAINNGVDTESKGDFSSCQSNLLELSANNDVSSLVSISNHRHEIVHHTHVPFSTSPDLANIRQLFETEHITDTTNPEDEEGISDCLESPYEYEYGTNITSEKEPIQLVSKQNILRSVSEPFYDVSHAEELNKLSFNEDDALRNDISVQHYSWESPITLGLASRLGLVIPKTCSEDSSNFSNVAPNSDPVSPSYTDLSTLFNSVEALNNQFSTHPHMFGQVYRSSTRMEDETKIYDEAEPKNVDCNGQSHFEYVPKLNINNDNCSFLPKPSKRNEMVGCITNSMLTSAVTSTSSDFANIKQCSDSECEQVLTNLECENLIVDCIESPCNSKFGINFRYEEEPPPNLSVNLPILCEVPKSTNKISHAEESNDKESEETVNNATFNPHQSLKLPIKLSLVSSSNLTTAKNIDCEDNSCFSKVTSESNPKSQFFPDMSETFNSEDAVNIVLPNHQYTNDQSTVPSVISDHENYFNIKIEPEYITGFPAKNGWSSFDNTTNKMHEIIDCTTVLTQSSSEFLDNRKPFDSEKGYDTTTLACKNDLEDLSELPSDCEYGINFSSEEDSLKLISEPNNKVSLVEDSSNFPFPWDENKWKLNNIESIQSYSLHPQITECSASRPSLVLETIDSENSKFSKVFPVPSPPSPSLSDLSTVFNFENGKENDSPDYNPEKTFNCDFETKINAELKGDSSHWQFSNPEYLLEFPANNKYTSAVAKDFKKLKIDDSTHISSSNQEPTPASFDYDGFSSLFDSELPDPFCDKDTSCIASGRLIELPSSHSSKTCRIADEKETDDFNYCTAHSEYSCAKPFNDDVGTLVSEIVIRDSEYGGISSALTPEITTSCPSYSDLGSFFNFEDELEVSKSSFENETCSKPSTNYGFVTNIDFNSSCDSQAEHVLEPLVCHFLVSDTVLSNDQKANEGNPYHSNNTSGTASLIQNNTVDARIKSDSSLAGLPGLINTQFIEDFDIQCPSDINTCKAGSNCELHYEILKSPVNNHEISLPDQAHVPEYEDIFSEQSKTSADLLKLRKLKKQNHSCKSHPDNSLNNTTYCNFDAVDAPDKAVCEIFWDSKPLKLNSRIPLQNHLCHKTNDGQGTIYNSNSVGLAELSKNPTVEALTETLGKQCSVSYLHPSLEFTPLLDSEGRVATDYEDPQYFVKRSSESIVDDPGTSKTNTLHQTFEYIKDAPSSEIPSSLDEEICADDKCREVDDVFSFAPSSYDLQRLIAPKVASETDSSLTTESPTYQDLDSNFTSDDEENSDADYCKIDQQILHRTENMVRSSTLPAVETMHKTEKCDISFTMSSTEHAKLPKTHGTSEEERKGISSLQLDLELLDLSSNFILKNEKKYRSNTGMFTKNCKDLNSNCKDIRKRDASSCMAPTKYCAKSPPGSGDKSPAVHGTNIVERNCGSPIQLDLDFDPNIMSDDKQKCSTEIRLKSSYCQDSDSQFTSDEEEDSDDDYCKTDQRIFYKTENMAHSNALTAEVILRKIEKCNTSSSMPSTEYAAKLPETHDTSDEERKYISSMRLDSDSLDLDSSFIHENEEKYSSETRMFTTCAEDLDSTYTLNDAEDSRAAYCETDQRVLHQTINMVGENDSTAGETLCKDIRKCDASSCMSSTKYCAKSPPGSGDKSPAVHDTNIVERNCGSPIQLDLDFDPNIMSDDKQKCSTEIRLKSSHCQDSDSQFTSDEEEDSNDDYYKIDQQIPHRTENVVRSNTLPAEETFHKAEKCNTYLTMTSTEYHAKFPETNGTSDKEKKCTSSIQLDSDLLDLDSNLILENEEKYISDTRMFATSGEDLDSNYTSNDEENRNADYCKIDHRVLNNSINMVRKDVPTAEEIFRNDIRKCDESSAMLLTEYYARSPTVSGTKSPETHGNIIENRKFDSKIRSSSTSNDNLEIDESSDIKYYDFSSYNANETLTSYNGEENKSNPTFISNFKSHTGTDLLKDGKSHQVQLSVKCDMKNIDYVYSWELTPGSEVNLHEFSAVELNENQIIPIVPADAAESNDLNSITKETNMDLLRSNAKDSFKSPVYHNLDDLLSSDDDDLENGVRDIKPATVNRSNTFIIYDDVALTNSNKDIAEELNELNNVLRPLSPQLMINTESDTQFFEKLNVNIKESADLQFFRAGEGSVDYKDHTVSKELTELQDCRTTKESADSQKDIATKESADSQENIAIAKLADSLEYNTTGKLFETIQTDEGDINLNWPIENSPKSVPHLQLNSLFTPDIDIVESEDETLATEKPNKGFLNPKSLEQKSASCHPLQTCDDSFEELANYYVDDLLSTVTEYAEKIVDSEIIEEENYMEFPLNVAQSNEFAVTSVKVGNPATVYCDSGSSIGSDNDSDYEEPDDDPSNFKPLFGYIYGDSNNVTDVSAICEDINGGAVLLDELLLNGNETDCLNSSFEICDEPVDDVDSNNSDSEYYEKFEDVDVFNRILGNSYETSDSCLHNDILNTDLEFNKHCIDICEFKKIIREIYDLKIKLGMTHKMADIDNEKDYGIDEDESFISNENLSDSANDSDGEELFLSNDNNNKNCERDLESMTDRSSCQTIDLISLYSTGPSCISKEADARDSNSITDDSVEDPPNFKAITFSSINEETYAKTESPVMPDEEECMNEKCNIQTISEAIDLQVDDPQEINDVIYSNERYCILKNQINSFCNFFSSLSQIFCRSENDIRGVLPPALNEGSTSPSGTYTSFPLQFERNSPLIVDIQPSPCPFYDVTRTPALPSEDSASPYKFSNEEMTPPLSEDETFSTAAAVRAISTKEEAIFLTDESEHLTTGFEPRKILDLDTSLEAEHLDQLKCNFDEKIIKQCENIQLKMLHAKLTEEINQQELGCKY